MTRAEWDRECRASIMRLLSAGVDSASAIRVANARCTAMYGARPDKPETQDVPAAPWWLRLGVSAVAGGKVDKIKVFVNRYLVLFSVVYAALSFGFEQLAAHGFAWAAYAKTVVSTLFGLLGVAPDPAVAVAVVSVGTAGFAFYGAVLKIIALIKGKPVPPPVIPAPELFK